MPPFVYLNNVDSSYIYDAFIWLLANEHREGRQVKGELCVTVGDTYANWSAEISTLAAHTSCPFQE